MKHLRKFELTSEYEVEKDSLKIPTVSYVVENKGIEYSTIPPPPPPPSIDEVWVPLGFRWSGDKTSGTFAQSGLTEIPMADTSMLTSGYKMFSQCSNLTTIPPIDTSNMTDISEMFYMCSNLTSIPTIDTSKVTNMTKAFAYCEKLVHIGDTMDLSSVTEMQQAFNQCNSLVRLPDLDVTHIPYPGPVISNCPALVDVKLKGINGNPLLIKNTSLSKESLEYMMNNAQEVSTHTIFTLSVTSLDKIDEAVQDALTAKGWEIMAEYPAP